MIASGITIGLGIPLAFAGYAIAVLAGAVLAPAIVGSVSQARRNSFARGRSYSIKYRFLDPIAGSPLGMIRVRKTAPSPASIGSDSSSPASLRARR